MKKIIIMNLLLIQIVIFSKKVIVIDQKMFRTEKDLYYEKSEKRNVIRLEYYSEECDIRKFLEEDTQGSIVYDGKKYKEISEIYEDYNNLEQKSYSRKADIVRKSYGVLFSKNKRYKVPTIQYFLDEDMGGRISYHSERYDSAADYKDSKSFNTLGYYYTFNTDGKLIEVWLERPIYWYVEFRLGTYQLNLTGLPLEVYKPRSHKEQQLKKENEIKKYLKQKNYTIQFSEPLNNKFIKTMEMKFNKNLEIIELFMQKVDFVDGTIGESITITFDKGKIINEVREK